MTMIPDSLGKSVGDSTVKPIQGTQDFLDNVLIENTMPALTGYQDVNQWLKPLRQLHIKNLNARSYVTAYPVGTQVGTYRQTKQVALTTTGPAGWSPARALGRFYCDSNGVWKINFTISGTFTSAAVTSISVGITGITFKNVTNANTSISATVGTATPSRAYTAPNTGTMTTDGFSTTTNLIIFSGDAELDSEPTTYTTQANMEGGNVAVASAPYGGLTAYSPTQNRIYLAPYNQATATLWQYIDCSNGSLVSYTHGATCVAGAYVGGVHSPTQDRTTGSVVGYVHGASGVQATTALGGCFCPTQNRIYFSPFIQSNQPTWYYIDCTNGAVVAYTHGATVGAQGYEGLAFSPTQNRIYMAPRNQATVSIWHYIDCSNGSVVAYTHGATGLTNAAYIGACYSPTQNRIYFIPGAHATATTWHYVDCSNGSIVAYTHGITAVGSAYQGAAYHPALNRIYMAPYYQASATQWHYIDCSNGSVVAYSHGQGSIVAGAYQGPCYSPLQNRIYLAPAAQATATVWHYIGATADTTGLSPHMFGSTILTSNF
jgi:hypothetical protein